MNIKILVVDDEKSIHDVYKHMFRGKGCAILSAYNGKEGLDVATREKPDLILMDLRMPISTGQTLLRQLRENHATQQTPIIVVSGDADVDCKVAVFEAGASDYVTKPFDIRELEARVKATLERHQNELSTSPLTGLPGSPVIQKQVTKRIQDGRPFAVLYLDIDHFKTINDTYGYLRGDEVITFLSDILVSIKSSRPASHDFVGHIGGDDFIYLCDPVNAEGVARLIADLFDAIIPTFYGEEDRQRSHVFCVNRKGEWQKFPLASLSIAIVTNERIDFGHYAEVVKTANEIKKFLKTSTGRQGSLFIKDRRTGAPYKPPLKPQN